jgi:hypothetical protein
VQVLLARKGVVKLLVVVLNLTVKRAQAEHVRALVARLTTSVVVRSMALNHVVMPIALIRNFAVQLSEARSVSVLKRDDFSSFVI